MAWGSRQDPDDARNPGAGTRHGWQRPDTEPKGAGAKILKALEADKRARAAKRRVG